MTTATETEPRDEDQVEDGDPKLDQDDPSLGVEPQRKMRKGALALLLVVPLGVVGGWIALRPPARSSAISEEPAAPPSVARPNSALPAFLEKPKPPPQPLATGAEPPPAPSAAPPAFDPPPAYPQQPTPPPPPDRATQRDLELEEEARNAGVSFKTSAPPAQQPSPSGDSYRAAPPPIAAAAPPGAAQNVGIGRFDQNLQDHKAAFLHDRGSPQDYLPNALQRPISRFELKASAVIPATLITGINSDLPGPITAQVRERVYDTVTGDHLLIPQGARLFGWYDSKVAWGQERVLLCWDRIVFPNGSSINLECMPAADLQGQAGLSDEVDNHWDRLAAAVGLSTILSVGTQAVAGSPTGYQPNLAQQAAANAAGQINSAGQAFVQRQLNLQPTVTIRPGFPVNLIVTKDLVLEPYVEGP